ncbi:MAG: hypothetical protein SCM11_02890 [Bacillota bacterium]|nr:hypothetical protein [Bacillota bacterium]
MTKFAPYPFRWDDVPIDISSVFKSEKPAGKHGFLMVDGDQFVFEDGTPGRFWGTNFNSGANFPDFEYSEKTARRLAKTGINIVRFHQLDAEWATPNIFQFTKGERKGTTRNLDPDSMKRLDYLIYCLKSEGIYCYFDMMTYRKFKSGDGVENAIALKDSAKPYSIFSRKLIDLQKEFAHDIWSHINPFTSLAYKDDPVFVMTEITNECDLFTNRFEYDVEPYHTELVGLMKRWLQDENLTYDADPIDFSAQDDIMIWFKIDLQERYYLEMATCMRQLGVKIPIAGTNWSINGANAKTQLVLDFNDGHTYWWPANWGEFTKTTKHKSMLEQSETFLPNLTFSRVLGKPFFVSEWDELWPIDWRAESPIFLAAVGSLQGWAGCTIHTYMYATKRDQQIIGKEMTSRSINNVPYREGIFATFIDPAKYGLFYHAALITRRADVRQANKTIAVLIEDMAATCQDSPAINLITEQSKVGLVFKGLEAQADETVSPDHNAIDCQSGSITSDTGELHRDWKKKLGWVDTAMTKCIYGFIEGVGEVSINGFTVRTANKFAVIALSSLTEKGINQTDNMLLTTVGRAENTNMKFNEDRTEMLDIGTPPIQIEVIEADVSIRTEKTDLRVLSISADGFLTGVIPSTYEDDHLKFHLGETCQSMYYLIQSE